jgi:hypothetical protein
MSSDPQPSAGAPEAPGESTTASHPHDFEVQKQVHRQIRNDPDYDDWEYGTEPLPHEAWVARQAQGSVGAEGNTGGSAAGSSAAASSSS